ncbi:MAG: metal-dependent hydrolase [Candidatus Woesearchaeota archaeon]
MLGRTHLIIGFLGYLLFVKALAIPHSPAIFFVMLFAALLPDIDQSNSLLGRKAKPIGWLVKHRGAFHSLVVGIIGSGIFWIAWNQTIALAFGFSYILHLLSDTLSKAGVELFWPAPWKLKGLMKVGGFAEGILFVVLVVLSVIVLFS